MGGFLFGWLLCMFSGSGIIGGEIIVSDVGYFDFVVGTRMEHMVYYDPFGWL